MAGMKWIVPGWCCPADIRRMTGLYVLLQYSRNLFLEWGIPFFTGFLSHAPQAIFCGAESLFSDNRKQSRDIAHFRAVDSHSVSLLDPDLGGKIENYHSNMTKY